MKVHDAECPNADMQEGVCQACILIATGRETEQERIRVAVMELDDCEDCGWREAVVLVIDGPV